MSLSDVSVRRPVFAIMMAAALILLGAFSYKDLGIDLMPKTESPVVTVTALLPGASAEEVETQLTRRIEESVNTISGIDELFATSDQGSSRVTIIFTLDRDIETAVQDVRDKLATIVNQFPRDTKPLVIQKVDPDATQSLSFSLQGDRDASEITQIADKQLKQVIETVKDVGSISFIGERKRQVQLLLNADRLNAYGLSVDQVRRAVQEQNVEVPGGSFVAGPSEVALRTMGRIKNVSDFNRIVLTYRNGSAITFGDIGRVEDSAGEVRSAHRTNGKASVAMLVRKQSGTNTLEVVDRVKERLNRIVKTLPPDLKVVFGTDQSIFIKRSFEDIRLHLVLGGLLASLVVFLFIRNLRVTFIAALAIPASIIGTFTVMRAFGFTLNNMTMLALVAGNRHRHRRCDRRAREHLPVCRGKGADAEGGGGRRHREIGLAVMATTLSLVVIFVPVAFMTGQIGRYFYSFGLTAATAILISMFVSFTLTPALCAWWMKPEDTKADHSNTKSSGLYNKSGCDLRTDARVVAPPPRSDDGDRLRRHDLSRLSVSLRRQGTRTRRRSGRVQHQRTPAEGHELPADGGVHRAHREGDTRAAGAVSREHVRESGVGELPNPHGPARRAIGFSAGSDAPRPENAQQVSRRPHQRNWQHRHLGRVVERGRRRRWRRRREQQPAQHSDPGARPRAAASLHHPAHGSGPHHQGRRRRRLQLRADTAGTTHRRRSQPAPPTSASASIRWLPTCARSWVARKCRNTRTATTSSW